MSDRGSQVAANKSIIERHFRAFDEKDYDLMESVTAPGMVHHATTLLPTRTGESNRRPRGAMRDPYLYLLAAFPDISFEIDRLVGEGDRVVARVHQRGTQRFKFQGLPPSDREVYVQQIHMFRIEDGKTTERWVARQDLRMLAQLGVVEAIGSPDPDESDGIDVPARSADAGTRSGNEPSAVDRKAIVRSILEPSYRPIDRDDPLPS